MTQEHTEILKIIKQYRNEKGRDPSLAEISEVRGYSKQWAKVLKNRMVTDGLLKHPKPRYKYKITEKGKKLLDA